MHIFIDEAGPFIPPKIKGQPTYSLVLALIVPTAAHKELCDGFLRIRDAWPAQAIEIKGSKLDEKQCAEIADLLAMFDVVAEAQIIDMGRHDVATLDQFKEQQAQAVTKHLTPQHQPTMVREMNEQANVFRALSDQLFAQAFLMMRLVMETAKIGMHYHVQRTPQELGNFTWVIDRKDRDLTAMEGLCSTFILPAGEAHLTTNRVARFKECDYSHFAKYEIDEATADQQWAQKLAWMREAYNLTAPPGTLRAVDWKKLVAEDRTFADSRNSLGLQLADIVATSLRRALKGNLQKEGWELFGRLFIRKHSSRFCALGTAVSSDDAVVEGRALSVWNIIYRHAKYMMVQSEDRRRKKDPHPEKG